MNHEINCEIIIVPTINTKPIINYLLAIIRIIHIKIRLGYHKK